MTTIASEGKRDVRVSGRGAREKQEKKKGKKDGRNEDGWTQTWEGIAK